MRINNFNKFSSQKTFENRVFSVDEATRNFLVSKGYFDVSTTIENNCKKYVFLYTNELKKILSERGVQSV